MGYNKGSSGLSIIPLGRASIKQAIIVPAWKIGLYSCWGLLARSCVAIDASLQLPLEVYLCFWVSIYQSTLIPN